MSWAVVTGSSGGIGSAIVSRFLEDGFEVLGLDLQEAKGNVLPTSFLQCDLKEFARSAGYRLGVKKHIDSVTSGQISVLVNNAAFQIVKPFHEIDPEEYQSVMDVNVNAPFLLIQTLLGSLEALGGCVVNIASIHGALTKPGFSAYATSKSALIGLTKVLAVELGSRIRVNAIAPAAIGTKMLVDGFEGRPEEFKMLRSMHPTDSIGTVDEVARAVSFLVDRRLPFLNGCVLGLDGGILGRLHDPV